MFNTTTSIECDVPDKYLLIYCMSLIKLIVLNETFYFCIILSKSNYIFKVYNSASTSGD